MTIGERIKQLRNEKNLSQDSFAEEFHVTRQTISNWENGKSYPDLELIVKISNFFGVTVDELLKGDEKIVRKIDSEKKKKNILVGTVVSIIALASVVLFAVYRHIEDINAISFSMTQSKTVHSLVEKTLNISTGYFNLPENEKINVQVKGDIDSGSMTVEIRNQRGQRVYRTNNYYINDEQVLQLEKGAYEIQITANDYTEETVSFSYDVQVHDQ